MSKELIQSIRLQTQALFTNADIMLKTCILDYNLGGMAIWKHVYHMFHSCDQWYTNPYHYTQPDFHEPNMNSLDIMTYNPLSREELSAYLEQVKNKIMNYLDGLTDDMLYDIQDGCTLDRLTMIMQQLRHFYAHLGNVNAVTIIEKDKYPRVVGTTGKCGSSTEGLYE